MSPLSSSSRTAARRAAAATSTRMRVGRMATTTYHGAETRINILQARQRWRSSSSSSKSGSLDATLTTIRWEDWVEQKKDQEEEGRMSSNFNMTGTNSSNPFLFPPFLSKSPAEDIQALLSTWYAKIPKGFENFYPKNKKKTGSSSSDGSESDKDTNDESSTSSSGVDADEGSSSTGSEASESPSSDQTKIDPKSVSFKIKGSGDGGGHKQQGSGPPPPPEEDPQNIPAMIALLLMVMAARNFFKDEDDIEGGEGEGGSSRSRGRNGREITFVDFRNYLLDQGQVEKIVVVNNNLARVILHPGSKGIPANIQHGVVVPTDVVMDGTASVQSKMHQHDGEPDSTVMEFNRPADGSSSDGSSGGSTVTASLGSLTGGVGGASSDSIHNTRHHPNTPVYHFYIGSIESFEDKLSKAQSDIHPREWVPVQYVNEVNLMVEFIKATPMLALVAILYYYSRGLMGSMGSGAGGGAGGMGSMFQVGKSNAKKINPESVKVNFGDVAGCQQAKQEVMEFVQFLSSPEQFTKLGAKIPKGALLCGPPGTGKGFAIRLRSLKDGFVVFGQESDRFLTILLRVHFYLMM